MSAKYPTRNDLPTSTRQAMVTLLNQNVASAIHLSLQAKQAHWNVKGPAFLQLHKLFDDVYEEVTEWVDLLAERAVQLGGVAEASLKMVQARTKLTSYPLDLADGPNHVDAVARSLADLGASVRKAIEHAEAANDAGTADLFTEVSRGVDKQLWFVEAHLHADR